MIKKLLISLIITLAVSNCVYAIEYHQTLTPEVRKGIQDYKSGNYVGCIQAMYPYLTKSDLNAKNQLAVYYLGMALSKTGDKERAKKYYNIAKILNPNNTIGQYSQKGLVCIEDPANCYLNVKKVNTNTKSVYESDLDKFINAPYGNGLSSDLNKEIERKKIERLRKEINSDQELNKYEFKNFRDFSNKKGQIFLKKDEGIKIASSENPTDAEIVNAIKVLNAAGLSNIANQAQTTQDKKNNQETVQMQKPIAQNEVKSEYKPDITREEYQKQIQREMMEAQMAAMSQPNIDALFGEKNNNNNNNMMNSNMMNMLPFMMAQQAQNGNTNGQQPMISPDMMQAMMFNSMMPNFNFGLGNGN